MKRDRNWKNVAIMFGRPHPWNYSDRDGIRETY